MIGFWQKLAANLESDRRVFTAIVAANSDHSPGTAGAKMLVTDTGENFGTIGGGAMERSVTHLAQEALQQPDFLPIVQTLYHRKIAPGARSGMICAGQQTNLYYVCQADRDLGAVREVIALLEADAPGVLRISPAGMHVRAGEFDPAAPSYRLHRPAEDTWNYEEQLLNRKRVAIIGGGHCSLALSRLMHFLGWKIFVFDTRPAVQTLRENRYAHQKVVLQQYRDAGPLIQYPEFTDVVVLTTDFQSDVEGLLGVLGRPFPFIGIMGSRAKIKKILDALRDNGINANSVDALHAPVGLPIDSHTPEEIAVSIAAHLLQERGKRRDGR